MRHFMCDLETLGRRAGCKILSIGLTEFNVPPAAIIAHLGLKLS